MGLISRCFIFELGGDTSRTDVGLLCPSYWAGTDNVILSGTPNVRPSILGTVGTERRLANKQLVQLKHPEHS